MVISGRFMSTIGYYLVIPFLTIHLIEDGITDLQAGLLLAVLNLTRRGLGIPAGWASDRFGAARVLTLGLAIEAVAYASFAGAGSFWTWAVGVTLLGTGGSLNNNGSRTLLATSGSNGAAVNFSRYYVMINAAALVGPLVGSVLLARDLMWIAFIAAAVLHLLFAAVTALALRAVPTSPAEGTGAAAIVSALRDRELVRYCAITIGGWFLITQFYVALPLTIAHQGLSTALLGPLNALNAAVVMVAVWLLSQRIAARSTLDRLTVLSFSGLVLAGGWVLCAISGLPVIVVAIVIVSVGESLFCAVVDVTAASLAPPGRSGAVPGLRHHGVGNRRNPRQRHRRVLRPGFQARRAAVVLGAARFRRAAHLRQHQAGQAAAGQPGRPPAAGCGHHAGGVTGDRVGAGSRCHRGRRDPGGLAVRQARDASAWHSKAERAP